MDRGNSEFERYLFEVYLQVEYSFLSFLFLHIVVTIFEIGVKLHNRYILIENSVSYYYNKKLVRVVGS